MKKIEENKEEQFAEEQLKMQQDIDRFYNQCQKYIRVADPTRECYSIWADLDDYARTNGHTPNQILCSNGFGNIVDNYEDDQEEMLDQLKTVTASVYMVATDKNIELVVGKDLLTVFTEDLQHIIGQELAREVIGSIEKFGFDGE